MNVVYKLDVSYVHMCAFATQQREGEAVFSLVLIGSRCLVKVKSEKKMFRKILRAQPSLSGPWPGQPIAAQHPLLLRVKEILLLDGDANVGVGSRCPGKVAESHLTHSKRKAKTFTCSTGQ